MCYRAHKPLSLTDVCVLFCMVLNIVCRGLRETCFLVTACTCCLVAWCLAGLSLPVNSDMSVVADVMSMCSQPKLTPHVCLKAEF